ncbi:LysR family transcriptional regulator [Pseudomonas sp. Marseille-QA0892]
MPYQNLDLDALRSFTLGIELGSFSRAADRLGRSTSAVSAQLRKLEQQLGVPLVSKNGRHLQPTLAGERLLQYGQRLLALNDEALAAIRIPTLQGRVRLGLQEDFGERLLPQVLGQYARAYPDVRVEAQVARSVELLDGLATGALDLALVWHVDRPAILPGIHHETLGEVPIRWIGNFAPEAWPWQEQDPLPLVLFDNVCPLQTCAIAALDRQGLHWRTAFTSRSLGGLFAAAGAGLGVMIRTALDLPRHLQVIDGPESSLPRLPSVSLSLHRNRTEANASADILESLLLDTLRAHYGFD